MKSINLFSILFVVLFLQIGFSAYSSIATDDFECNSFNCGTGWSGSWNYTGTCQISRQNAIGSYNMRGRSSCDAKRYIDTTGYTEVLLNYSMTARSLENNDFCYLYYYNGTDEVLLKNITNGDDDRIHDGYSSNLTQYGVSSNSYIRFVSPQQSNDYCYLDEIEAYADTTTYLKIYSDNKYPTSEKATFEFTSSLTNIPHTFEIKYPNNTILCSKNLTSPSVASTSFSTSCTMPPIPLANMSAFLYVTSDKTKNTTQLFNVVRLSKNHSMLKIDKVYFSPQILQGGQTEIFVVIDKDANLTLERPHVTITFPDLTKRRFSLDPTINRNEYRAFITDTYQIGTASFVVRFESDLYYDQYSNSYEVVEYNASGIAEEFWKMKRGLTVHGTTYSQFSSARSFVQYVVDGEPFSDADCTITAYYPDNTIWIENESMTPLNGAGLYYYDTFTSSRTGVYMVIASCTYAGVTDYALGEIVVENRMNVEVFGTEYMPGEEMKIFSQVLIDGEPQDDAACIIDMYYPNNTIWIEDVLMQQGEDALNYYDAYAPNEVGVYMTSIECFMLDNETILATYRPNASVGKDAYIDSGNPTTNYGSTNIMYTTDNKNYSLMYFNISNISGQDFVVIASYLGLASLVPSGPAPYLNAHTIDSTWFENNVTWNNQPTYTKLAGPPVQVNPFGLFYYNMINYSQQVMDESITSHGLMINSTGSNITWYGSSDYGAAVFRPALHILYNKNSSSLHYKTLTEIKIVNYSYMHPNVVAEHVWNSSAFDNSNAMKNITKILDKIDGLNISANISSIITKLDTMNLTLNNVLGNVTGLPQKIDDLNASVYNVIYKLDSLDSRISGNFSLVFGNFTRNYNKISDINENFSLVFGNISQMQSEMNNNFDLLFNNISNLENNLGKNFTLIFGNISEFRSEVKQNFSLVFGNLSLIYADMTNEFELLRQNISYINASTSQIGGIVLTVNKIYDNTKDMNHSFDLVNGNLTVLQTTINNVENKVDLVLSNLTYIDGEINNNFNLIFGNLSSLNSNIDSNFSIVYSNLSTIRSENSNNFNLIFGNLTNIYTDTQSLTNDMNLVFGNLSDIYWSIQALNNSFDLVYGNISLVLNDTNTILTKIDNLNVTMTADLVNLTNRLIEINTTTHQLQQDLNLIKGYYNDTVNIEIITNPIWYANNTAVVFFHAFDSTGAPLNLTNRRIEIFDPAFNLLINTTSMVAEEDGYWKYSYYIGSGATTGQYLIKFYGTSENETRVVKNTPRVHVGGVFDNVVIVTDSCGGKVFANITIINFGEIGQDVTVRYWIVEGTTNITGKSQQTFYVGSKQRTTLPVVKAIPKDYVSNGNEKRIMVELIHNPNLPIIVSYDTFYSTDTSCLGESTGITTAIFLPFIREERDLRPVFFFFLAIVAIVAIVTILKRREYIYEKDPTLSPSLHREIVRR